MSVFVIGLKQHNKIVVRADSLYAGINKISTRIRLIADIKLNDKFDYPVKLCAFRNQPFSLKK